MTTTNNTTLMKTKIKRAARRAPIAVFAALASATAGAAPIAISDVPLFAQYGASPNILLTMDSSGSMSWGYMPDSIVVDLARRAAKSSSYNKIYYNPLLSYQPGKASDGSSLGDASFTGAWVNAYDIAGRDAAVVNLATSFRPTWGAGGLPRPPEPAYYYVFDANPISNPSASSPDCDVAANNLHPNCYRKVVVGASSGPGGADERQNFANWYAYYRTRELTAKTAVTRAFSRLDDSVRVGYQHLRSPAITGVQSFSGAHRTQFFNWLNTMSASGSTPLRRFFDRAGDYFTDADPYRDVPGDSSSVERSCRQNFHISMTDGFWNSGAGRPGNIDNTAATLPESSSLGISSYNPAAATSQIYSDDNTAALADNAFYYWVNDLRPELSNDVPVSLNHGNPATDSAAEIYWNPQNNPANWQHMVNFTIGLGVNGALDFPADYPDLLSGAKNWGLTANNSINNIDDLWHAAINSRGQYFSAGDPQQLADAFRDILGAIQNRRGSAVALSLSSGSALAGGAVFQATFDTDRWSGQLLARQISDGQSSGTCSTATAGEICASAAWDAACVLTGGACNNPSASFPGIAPNDRVIITRSSAGAGVPFLWDDLPPAEQALLQRPADPSAAGKTSAEYRLEYLRGDRAYERPNSTPNGDGFRRRSNLLGDIINSAPVYVGPPSRFYPDAAMPGYSAFRTANAGRQAVVYVGANDGFLHGFNAQTGAEVLAYAPQATFAKLADLSDPDYAHASYADGPITVEDAELGAGWRTVLAAGLGLGAPAVYALDVTDPNGFSEANADAISMWEFSDPELGYVTGKVEIYKVQVDDRWVAIFGNGYNNAGADGDAVLFVVDLESGALLRKISTRTGSAEDPSGAARINGLGAITPVDVDGDFYVDYVYAGDLFGNVWKFDLRGTTLAGWQISHGSAASPQPLFTALDSFGQAQPITTALSAGQHPSGEGVQLFFGTGQYLGAPDLTNLNTQSVYGIWDRFDQHTAFDRSYLLEQQVIGVDSSSHSGYSGRALTDHPINWYDGPGLPDPSPPVGIERAYLGWYLDLPQAGERVHQPLLLRNGRLAFVTIIPNPDPCSAGGISWLMELDAASGGRLPASVFDLNNDGTFNGDDAIDIAGGVSASGVRGDNDGIYYGIGSLLLSGDGSQESRLSSTSDPDISTPVVRGLPRYPATWRELRGN